MKVVSMLIISIFCLTFSAANDQIIQNQRQHLVLRQVSGFCDTEHQDYTCFFYSDFGFTSDDINAYLSEFGNEIHELTIENPSYVIYDIQFKKLKELRVVNMFGNDYNTDGLTFLPKNLLRLPNLEVIDFYGVRFPLKDLELLKKTYPKIKFSGDISEY